MFVRMRYGQVARLYGFEPDHDPGMDGRHGGEGLVSVQYEDTTVYAIQFLYLAGQARGTTRQSNFWHGSTATSNRTPKQVPTPALMDALIEAARKRQRPRDVAIFLILRFTGMRRASVATLQARHLDGLWGLRRVRVKGGRTRDIPLPEPVMRYLHAYVEQVVAPSVTNWRQRHRCSGPYGDAGPLGCSGHR